MDGFRSLLVPLDGSSLAEAVLPLVTLFAERTRAAVLLLHVIERDAPETIHGESHLTNVEQAEAYLERIAEGLKGAGIEATTHVHPNPQEDVAGAIADHARESNCDLVVLATHGWGGLRDRLVGSIAQQVLNRGTWPVLLVRPTAKGAAPHFEARRVLVPLAGTASHDEPVISVAAAAAKGLGATLSLVMVVATLRTLGAERSASATLLPQAAIHHLELKRHDAAEYLERTAARLAEQHLTVETLVVRGEPAASVRQAAHDTRADLIVMSTHGRVGWAAFWAGSVGAKILSRSEQPLLLVKVDGAKR